MKIILVDGAAVIIGSALIPFDHKGGPTTIETKQDKQKVACHTGESPSAIKRQLRIDGNPYSHPLATTNHQANHLEAFRLLACPA